MAALTEQIVAFKQELPRLRRDHGSAWAVLSEGKVRGAFPDFKTAANFALTNFGGEQFLIRHTDEHVESAPFMVLED